MFNILITNMVPLQAFFILLLMIFPTFRFHEPLQHKNHENTAVPFQLTSPSLLFTKSQLEELKLAIKGNSGTLKSSYDNLIVRSNAGLSYQTEPYTGTDSQEFYMRLKDPSGLARNLALAYALTNDEKYALKSIEIMKEWAIKCQDIDYVKYAGTSMMISRSLFPFLCAYDILKNSPHLDKESEIILRSWFLSLVPQVKEGIYIWHQNDYFKKQEYQNHLASHVLGVLALGVVLEDQSLIQLAIDSDDNPRDLYELISGCILMEGDKPHHREGSHLPPPESGEIYDRYRLVTNPLKGLGYAHLTLSQLAMAARICYNNNLDVFAYTAPGGEKLLLPFEYYSDFYRLKDGCIKSKFYCPETNKIGRTGDSPGLFELGLAQYPNSEPLQALISSGAFDRATAYSDILGFFRLFSASVDPLN